MQSFRHESRRSSTPLLDGIDLEALCHNVDLVRNHLGPDRHIIAALKGDASGHWICSFAKRLVTSGVHCIAIGSLRDAHAIREAGGELPILMYGGPLPEGIPPLLQHGLTPPCMTKPDQPRRAPQRL